MKNSEMNLATSQSIKGENSLRNRPRVSLTIIKTKNQANDFDIFRVFPRLLPITSYRGKIERCRELALQGQLLLESGKYDESCKYFQESLNQDKLNSFVLINFSASLILVSSYKKAAETLDKICFRKEEFLVGMFNKSLALIYLKQFGQALSLILSIEKYADEGMIMDLKVMKSHCEKMNEILTSPRNVLNKSKSVLGNFKFPYIQSQSSERLIKGSFIQTSSRKSTLIPERMPSLQISDSLPKPLVKITSAYQNFITNNKKRTTNILDKINGTNEITGKDIDNAINDKPRQKYEGLETKISEIPKNNFNKDENQENVLNKQLNSNEIREIFYEYCKPSPVRNVSRIASLLKKLTFFSKFTEKIIAEIVKKSEIEKYTDGQAIISQGELGDKMFIILTGLVSVKKKSDEFGGMEIQVNTLYQGETFGEMALLAETDDETLKRSASCVASDETTVITMSKTDYKHILLYMMKNDIHGKAHFFCALPLFPGTDHYSMVPLAANIEPVTYSINEIILEAGDIPQGLYIIYKGHCSVQWEGYILRKKLGNRTARTKVPKAFYSDRILESKKYKSKLLTEAFDPTDSHQILKASQYLKTDKLNHLMKKFEVYKKSIELFKLKAGDFFGGRALVMDLLEPAKFTVVADSLDVKVFVFKFKHFSMLPEYVVVRDR